MADKVRSPAFRATQPSEVGNFNLELHYGENLQIYWQSVLDFGDISCTRRFEAMPVLFISALPMFKMALIR
jgi:hypothetical protein